MSIDRFRKAQERGENIVIEFKGGRGGISTDTYDTVCSFLNRFGGDLYLGVGDNGNVVGIPEKAVAGLVKNFINTIGNPEVINPTVYLDPEPMVVDGKHIVHIYIPQSSEVHTHKKIVYDRVGDADVKVTATGQIAQMYIRKQKIFTEKKVFPYISDDDLRLDMLPRLRQMAINRRKDHPWKNLSDEELLQGAGLISRDAETGKIGYNLATVLLLGRDHVIKDVCPTYRTDALLRKVNVDRYDDRLIVETNLVDSYELLRGFAEKHLSDKFYLERDIRVSLRDAILREILANTLIHREFSINYIAKFIIEKDRMYTENANRAVNGEAITPQNLEPIQKNPLIAAFFRNIGLADELGSGVRNLYYYAPRYSGQNPQLLDGDIFRTIVPLDDSYSFDAQTKKGIKRYSADGKTSGIKSGKTSGINQLRQRIIELMLGNPRITASAIAQELMLEPKNIEANIRVLKKEEIVKREGGNKGGYWVVKEDLS